MPHAHRDHPHTPAPSTAAIVLAGGAARRLAGRDKTRLPVGGVPTLERVLRSAPVQRRIVVGPEGEDGAGIAERHGARFVREEPELAGPAAALARGVAELGDLGDTARVLVLGGDMPLLRTETLHALLDRAALGRVAALAREDGTAQFLTAAWPLALLRQALAAVERPGTGWQDLALRAVYAQLAPEQLELVPATGAEAADLDTPEDVAAAERAAGPRIALAQIEVSEDVDANLETVRRAAERAAGEGARVLVLPEATLTPFGTDLRAAAEAHDERFAALLEALGEQHGLTIIAGSFSPADGTRVHNTLLVRGGGVSAEYRKIHLYDAYGSRESETVAPGEELVVIEVDGVRIGLATCYDVRFPAQFQALARRGAQAVVLPLAWGDGPGKSDQLQVLLRARALDATCVLLAADQAPPAACAGRAPRGIGESAVIGPLGQVRSRLGREEGMLLAEIDLEEIAQARRALPVLEHGAGDSAL
ncbi:NTP transferase domain-containing protein [Brachybacterium horti]